jgi:hypothetical protein
MQDEDRVRVVGALLLAVEQACVNLSFFIDEPTRQFLRQVTPTDWYPLRAYSALLELVGSRYADPAPIYERIGSEIIRLWYLSGGAGIVGNAVEFLRFQTSSQGYYSVVDGPPDQIGTFALTELDEQAGRAVLHSTTPFSKDLERGILLAGISVPEPLAYVSVDNSADVNTYRIEFHR